MRYSWLMCLLVSMVVSAPTEDNAQGKKWAVLIAGSQGIENYGDQSDVSHAYQILHRHGIPDENIIVFMYDDVATDPENPKRGVLINKPNGPNVYKGVKKDYVNVDVTPENFLAALTGNKTTVGGKKVLESGPNDHVFVYFADHGDSGLIYFPSTVLYADDLVNALKTMHEKKMYKKMLLYIESCFSGSMVAGKLPNNIDILVATAANAHEPAWRTYCDVSGYPCLGNDFGVGWMEQTDKDEGSVLKKETVNAQYKATVKRSRGHSHPSMYGQKVLKKDLIKDFIGVAPKEEAHVEPATPEYNGPKVSIQDSYLFYINKKIQETSDERELEKLRIQKTNLMEGRKEIDELFSNIMSQVDATDDEMNVRADLSMEEMPCYKTLVENFRQQCVNINKNTYVQAHLYKLANLCTRDNFSPEQVLNIFSTECTEQHRQLNRVN